MGLLIYKVSPTSCGELNGRPVYPIAFAYKPYSGLSRTAELDNITLHNRYAARYQKAWEAKPLWERQKTLVCLGNTVFELVYCVGYLYDEEIDTKPVATGFTPSRALRGSFKRGY